MAEPWMNGAIIAWIIAVMLRAIGAAVREMWTPIKGGGWIFCALAAWMVAAAAGAWVPLWMVLLLGVAGAVVGYYAMAERGESHPAIRPGADAVFVLGMLITSWSPVDATLGGVFLVLYVGIGALLDLVAGYMPKWLTVPGAAVAIVGLILIVEVDVGQLERELWQEDKLTPLFQGIAVPDAGERVRLETGGVAWVLRPTGEPEGGVLFLHGADAEGAHQSAAFPLQRALLQRGYTVVSLDHVGYGASPHPAEEDSLSAWDPLPSAEAAYELLQQELPHDVPRIAMGHSMGVRDVNRLLVAGRAPEVAVLIGGAVSDSSDRDDYWYDRFHYDRGMDWRLSREEWKEIRERYYGRKRPAEELSTRHAPILFVQFGIEWPNVREQRTPLWEAIPGQKRLVELDSMTHYFNSTSVEFRFIRRWLDQPLILSDTRVVARLQQLLDDIEEEGRFGGEPEASRD